MQGVTIDTRGSPDGYRAETAGKDFEIAEKHAPGAIGAFMFWDLSEPRALLAVCLGACRNHFIPTNPQTCNLCSDKPPNVKAAPHAKAEPLKQLRLNQNLLFGQGRILNPACDVPALAQAASVPGKPCASRGRANNAGMDGFLLGAVPVLTRARPKRITFGRIRRIPLRNLVVIPLPISSLGFARPLLLPPPLPSSRRRILARHYALLFHKRWRDHIPCTGQ